MSEVTVLHGDCIAKMRELPDESVHCIITSPPYHGLRDYQIPPTIWGGASWPKCRHRWKTAIKEDKRHQWKPGQGGFKDNLVQNGSSNRTSEHAFCRCGAWRGVFGLEPTPELYVEHAVMVFAEAYRVLRKDGTLWVNLGDSYTNDSKWGGQSGGKNATSAKGGYQGQRLKRGGRPDRNGRGEPQRRTEAWLPSRPGGKSGNLVGIPWRVALALQEWGWQLRRDNIWEKPNPMPESVVGWRWEQHRVRAGVREAHAKKPSGWNTAAGSDRHDQAGRFNDNQEEAIMENCPGCAKCDHNGGMVLRKGNWRCTTSHEYVFQFSKSASYFCDGEPVREKASGAHSRGAGGVNPKAKMAGRNSRMAVDRDLAHQSAGQIRSKQNQSFSAAVRGTTLNRNKRSVWRIATQSYRGAHFATFPLNLVRPIVAAATPVHCCGKCGAPYAPIIERGEPIVEQQLACGANNDGGYLPTGKGKFFDGTRAQNARTVKQRVLAGMVEKKVTGYFPTCRCHVAETTPAVVLDMFGGSGTVGQVAKEMGRSAILIEISEAYIPLIHQRCDNVTSRLI